MVNLPGPNAEHISGIQCNDKACVFRANDCDKAANTESCIRHNFSQTGKNVQVMNTCSTNNTHASRISNKRSLGAG